MRGALGIANFMNHPLLRYICMDLLYRCYHNWLIKKDLEDIFMPGIPSSVKCMETVDLNANRFLPEVARHLQIL